MLEDGTRSTPSSVGAAVRGTGAGSGHSCDTRGDTAVLGTQSWTLRGGGAHRNCDRKGQGPCTQTVRVAVWEVGTEGVWSPELQGGHG